MAKPVSCLNCGSPLKWRETEGQKYLACGSCFACFIPMRKGGLEQVVRGLGQAPPIRMGQPTDEPTPKRPYPANGSKLRADDVRAIRQRLKDGETPKSIAADYPVAESSIADIKARRTWKEVGDG